MAVLTNLYSDIHPVDSCPYVDRSNSEVQPLPAELPGPALGGAAVHSEAVIEVLLYCTVLSLFYLRPFQKDSS